MTAATSARVRIGSRWFRTDVARRPGELASVAAAIVWRTADARVRHMRSVGFAVDAGEPYVRVLVELLCFLIAIADRIAYRHEPGPWRDAFTSALVVRTGELFQQCFEEILGRAAAGGFQERFIERCNGRMEEYAACESGPDGPDFAFLRHFGNAVAAGLPREVDRPWSADQAMSIEGPAAAEILVGALQRLLASALERGVPAGSDAS